MKKIIKNLTIAWLIAVCIVSSMLLTLASEVNSITANIGDTITYELRVNPCPDKIQALDIVIYYDSNSLEYVPYSLELPNISGFMTNTNISGEIRFNAMDFDGFSFLEDKILSNVQFTVKDTTAQDLNLTYEVKAFIDSNTIDLSNTYIYDVTSVNGGTEKNVQNDNSSEPEIDSELSSLPLSTDNDDPIINNDSDSEILSDTGIITDADINTESNHNLSDDLENVLSNISSDNLISESSSIISSPQNTNNQYITKLYIISAAVAVITVIFIGIIFSIAAKRSNNGSHFS